MEAWAAEGGCKVAVYREKKTGDGCRKLLEYEDGTPLEAGILWTKRRAYAVLRGVRGSKSDAAEVAAAVQRVLDNAQDGQEWPEEMPERARQQVTPGDGKCLYWALSAVDGAGGQAAAEDVRRALTEGDMARPPELGWARRVMRDAGARTWDQYLDKVRRGEIWGGACEVGRWAQSKGCRIAMYQGWGPRGVFRKMAEVGEGKRTAAALLWSRRGGGLFELLWPPEEEEAEAVVEAEEEDGAELKDEEEKAREVELAEAGPEKGEEQGGQMEEQVWQDVHQIQIQGRGERWWYQGQEGPGRERREVGGGTARDRKPRAGWEVVLGVQVQEMEYVEVPEGTGKGEWQRRQAAGVDVWVTGGGEEVLQPQHRDDVGTGWGAERAVQMRTDRAVWLEPGWRGRYRMAAGGQRQWGWHMTWQADKGEGVPVKNEWGGELPGGGQDASGVQRQFTRAALSPAPTTQGHRAQELMYTFSKEMTLKAAEAIKMVLDEGAACMAHRTYHVHPDTGDTWHCALPGDNGMESTASLPECERQGSEILALARVAEEWVRETGGEEHGKWAVGAIRRARYRKGE